MPKRTVASTTSKHKSIRSSDKSMIVEAKRIQVVKDEETAISSTTGQIDIKPNRRLTDFIFHDADGKPQPVEMLEVYDLYVSGLILSLEGTSGEEKDTGVRGEGFGPIESWAISGMKMAHQSYGSPQILLIMTVLNLPPATKSCMVFSLKRLMHVLKFIKDYQNLLEAILTFVPMSSLQQLFKEKSKKCKDFEPAMTVPSGVVLRTDVKTGDGDTMNQLNTSTCATEEDEDMKLASLLQEKENWQSLRHKKRQWSVTSSNKFYLKINEDEFANDYPFPAYYKTSIPETDEYIIFDNDMDGYNPVPLPRSMLHNWSLYNSDSRLISLELLPMKPCADTDVTIYGSGIMTADDGRFCLDADSHLSSSSSSGAQDVDGIPTYLSAIKEWMIELGSSMVFISIRTDMAWYRLGKPSKQYTPWYEPVLKTARLAISIITLLKEQSRVSRLSFADVIKSVSEFNNDHPSCISTCPIVVERFITVNK